MTPKEYIRESRVTDTRSYDVVSSRMDENALRMMHYSLGIGTEAGEIQDIFKKHVMYGKSIDITHLKEEMGDLLWYMGRMLELVGSSFEEVMQMNTAKLKARYGKKFTEDAAINRNLLIEQTILENTKL